MILKMEKYKPQRYVISDLHGDYKALKEVMKDFNYEKDELVCIGDIVDGYSQTYECVELLLKVKNCTLVKGNHDCVAEGTEVLTDSGWVNIESWNGKDKIGQYDINTKEISFDSPSAYIINDKQKCISIESYDTKQVVSENHDVLINGNKIKAKHLIGKNIKNSSIPNVGVSNNKINISDDYIRYYTWIITDGCLYESSENSVKVQFKLSKQRKIKKLRQLLDKIGIKYTYRKATKSGLNKLQPYVIRIYGQYARDVRYYLGGIKEIPDSWRNLSKDQLKIFFDTILDTDGYDASYRTEWDTINRHNLDIIQEACVKNEFRTSISERKNNSGFANGKIQYKMKYFSGNRRNFNVEIEDVGMIKTYCFTMPKGTLVTRNDGKCAITGNCWFIDWFSKGKEPYIWLSQGGENTIYSYKSKGYEANTVPQEHKDLFLNAVNFHEVDKMLFVHGGIDYPKHPVNTDKHFLMWDRTLIDRFIGKLQVKEWDKIFIGHTTTEREGSIPVRYDVEGFASLIRVDCGAGWKGKLCLYNIDTDEYVLSEQCLGFR